MKDADAAEFPSRRPWLVILVVLAVGGALWLRYASRNRPPPPAEPAAPALAPAVPRPAAQPTQSVAVARQIPTNSPPPATPVAVSAPTAPPVVTNIEDRLGACTNFEAQGRLVDARTNYLALLRESLSADDRQTVEQRLGKVDISLVTTPMAMPEKEEYIVGAGDSMDKIARKFGTTVLLIQRGNERTNSLIKAGDRLRVFKGKFEVAVSKSRNELLLTMNGEFFKRYGAGTGRYGKTPAGTFVIADKVVEPPWWRPDGQTIPYGDPANILGTRWMALRATGSTLPVKGYGIHGTWDDASVGKAESAGCVRLRNKDVEELFDLLPYGTPVSIVE